MEGHVHYEEKMLPIETCEHIMANGFFFFRCPELPVDWCLAYAPFRGDIYNCFSILSLSFSWCIIRLRFCF